MDRCRYEVGYLTHPGNVRPVNQDSLLIRRGSMGKEEFLLLAVADGMGGLAEGELASALAMAYLDRWWCERLPAMLAPDLDWTRISESLRSAIEGINRAIYRTTLQEGRMSGTTLTGVFLYRDQYRIFHTGDSRAYLLDKEKRTQLTQDQTWCQQEIQSGRMTREEASTHPWRHKLISSLGVTEDYTLAEYTGKLAPGQALLLCSDGFYQAVSRDWPGKQLRRRSLQMQLDRASGQILNGPATDNFSAILVRKKKWWC